MQSNFCKAQLEGQLLTEWEVLEAVNNTCRTHFDDQSLADFVGCFRDNNATNPLLSAFRYNFSSQNNPPFCVQSCLRAGFPLAGLEFGVECFCGSFTDANKLLDLANGSSLSSYLANASRCMESPCPAAGGEGGNGGWQCGGPNAIAIYRTGVIGGDHTAAQLTQFQPLEFSDAANFNGTEGPTHDQRAANVLLSKKEVKILFLLQLNGRDSRQVRRLLRLIYSGRHLYYVHVDRRQPFMHSEMMKVGAALVQLGHHNFWVTPDRFATIWGGTSLLELFLRVIAETTITSIDGEGQMGGREGEWAQWDYIVNLSEADMPLLALEELEHNLASNFGKSFLSSHGYNTANFLHKQGFNYLFMECEQRMWRIAQRTKFPRNLRLDGGSDWLVIHRDLAQFAVSRELLPSQLRQWFTTVLLPLESFFHTLALNSYLFCAHRLLYRNLRFTNWRRRKQGCRCALLKPVVDWCGCSPLAMRADETAAKLTVQRCQQKMHFFGRKFDSLVDAGAIGLVERQVLRFRADEPNGGRAGSANNGKPPSNSTWLNLFSARVPTDQPPIEMHLLEAFSRSLLMQSTNYNSVANNNNCAMVRVLELHIYCQHSPSPHQQPQPQQGLISIELQCDDEDYDGGRGADRHNPQSPPFEIQLLFAVKEDEEKQRRRPQSQQDSTVDGDDDDGVLVEGEDGKVYQFDADQGIQFGLGFDLKEELFRVQPPLVSLVENGAETSPLTSPTKSALSSVLTLKWNWKMIAAGKDIPRGRKGITSPPVELELRDQKDAILLRKHIGAYDSVNGNQFANVQHLDGPQGRQPIVPGTWKAVIYTVTGGKATGTDEPNLTEHNTPANEGRTKIAEREFPVFPTPSMALLNRRDEVKAGEGERRGEDEEDELQNERSGMQNQFDGLVSAHFELIAICAVQNDDEDGERGMQMMAKNGINKCSRVPWSSLYPDEKSMFP